MSEMDVQAYSEAQTYRQLPAWEAATAAFREAERAKQLHGDFHSVHEGLGVLMEEWHELIDAIHKNDKAATETEAVQVAAMAIRLVAFLRQ